MALSELTAPWYLHQIEMVRKYHSWMLWVWLPEKPMKQEKRKNPLRRRRYDWKDDNPIGRYKEVTFVESYSSAAGTDKEWAKVRHFWKSPLEEKRAVCPGCIRKNGFNLTLEETTSYLKRNQDRSYSCVRCGLVFTDKISYPYVVNNNKFDRSIIKKSKCKDKVLEFLQTKKNIEGMTLSDFAKEIGEPIGNIRYHLKAFSKNGKCNLTTKDVKNVKNKWVTSPCWKIEKKKRK